MSRIIQHKRHLGIAQRLTLLRTCKNNIFHFSAAERLRTLLAHYPSYGIGNITLSASVGADNGGYSLMYFYYGLVRKGLKALKLYSFKVHYITFFHTIYLLYYITTDINNQAEKTEAAKTFPFTFCRQIPNYII